MATRYVENPLLTASNPISSLLDIQKANPQGINIEPLMNLLSHSPDPIGHMHARFQGETQWLADHYRRTSRITFLFCKILGLSEKESEIMAKAGENHDLGKFVFSDQKLNQTKWTEGDTRLMDNHRDIGALTFQQLSLNKQYEPKMLELSRVIALTHHEQWNGKGPLGLAGEEIPVFTRLFTITDVWDAISGNRPYLIPKSRDEAIAEMGKSAGTQIDPYLTEKFVHHLNQII